MLTLNHTKVVHNFNSGPSILPKEVFEQASNAIIDFNNTGLSILELGHRTSLFQEVMDEAIATTKELMNLDDEHEVMFLHGGASTQFFQVPMNLLNDDETAAYLDCGTWGMKAAHFDKGRKYAQKLARGVREAEADIVVADCTLSALRIADEARRTGDAPRVMPPIEALAEAYGLGEAESTHGITPARDDA